MDINDYIVDGNLKVTEYFAALAAYFEIEVDVVHALADMVGESGYLTTLIDNIEKYVEGDMSAFSIQVGDIWQDAMGNNVVIVSLDSDGLNKDYPIVGIMQSGVNEGRARIYASNGVDLLHAPRSLVKLVKRGN